MSQIRFTYYDSSGEVKERTYNKQQVLVGGAAECDVAFRGLKPLHCRIYETADGNHYVQPTGGEVYINGSPAPGYIYEGDVLQFGSIVSMRVAFPPVPAAQPQYAGAAYGSPPARVPPPVAVPEHFQPRGVPQSYAPAGRTNHSPVVALLFSIFFPGAGQAYNGRPLKGMFVLLFSVLILPWIYGIIDAYRTAAGIVRSGGRTGSGGWGWVVLHIWLAGNFALLSLIGLTVAGVLK